MTYCLCWGGGPFPESVLDVMKHTCQYSYLIHTFFKSVGRRSAQSQCESNHFLVGTTRACHQVPEITLPKWEWNRAPFTLIHNLRQTLHQPNEYKCLPLPDSWLLAHYHGGWVEKNKSSHCPWDIAVITLGCSRQYWAPSCILNCPIVCSLHLFCMLHMYPCTQSPLSNYIIWYFAYPLDHTQGL